MEALIKKKLNEIEKAKGIEILYAVESGSRMWGRLNVNRSPKT